MKFIGNHSGILRTIMTPWGKFWGKKWQKLAKKLIKIAQNCVVFLYIFGIYSLKIFAVGGLGGHNPQKPPPVYAPFSIDAVLCQTTAALQGQGALNPQNWGSQCNWPQWHFFKVVVCFVFRLCWIRISSKQKIRLQGYKNIQCWQSSQGSDTCMVWHSSYIYCLCIHCLVQQNFWC